jgi:glycosyltransferase involved in cell wall biosynthesis
VLAGSRFVKETLLAEGISDEKVHVVNYGVDVEQFRPRPEGARDGKFVLLFAGAIMQRKGISYLLEARSRLSLRDLELVLCGGIAGSGNGLKPYAGTFRHIGHTPHATMPAIYQQADVFVLPSLVEGLSLVLLEALASGLPVITTPNSGAMGLIEDGVQGFIVPIRDPDAIAERIAFLHGNPDRCREMGKAARRLALKHSWKRYGQELNHLFGQLLG